MAVLFAVSTLISLSLQQILKKAKDRDNQPVNQSAVSSSSSSFKTVLTADGVTIYEGHFSNELRHGLGRSLSSKATRLKEYWLKGRFVGIFEGQEDNTGFPHGEGVLK